MKAVNFNGYNPEFPETFTWYLLDSLTLSFVAKTIADNIHSDLKTETRLETPGLRRALNIIANEANILGE